MYMYRQLETHLNVDSLTSSSILSWLHLLPHVYLVFFTVRRKGIFYIVMLKLSSSRKYYILLKYVYILIKITISKVQLQIAEIVLAI